MLECPLPTDMRKLASCPLGRSPPSLLRIHPSTLPSCLSRPGHAGRDMIARAVFAFLFLQDRIIHVDVVEDGRQILMSQEFLERKGIVALNEVVHGKGVSQDVRTDALSLDPRTFFEPLEEHLHAILGQRLAGFGEEEVILSGAASLRQLFFARTMPIQVVGEIAQAVLSQRHPPLLRPLAQHRDDPVPAIDIAHS